LVAATRFRVACLTATRARLRSALLIAFNALLTDLSTSPAASRAALAAVLASLIEATSKSPAARLIVSAATRVCPT
jgi:hypothetical protein